MARHTGTSARRAFISVSLLSGVILTGSLSAVGASAASTSQIGTAVPAETATAPCPAAVAHRGGVGEVSGVTENSMAAFRRAIRAGVWAVETDVQLTKDLVPVLMHDATLYRTTRGSGRVSDYTYRQLRKIRLDNGQRIPKLAKLLRLLHRKQTAGVIEYKGPDRARHYRAYLRVMRGSQAEVFGAGFSARLMRWLDRKQPQLPEVWFGLKSTGSAMKTELTQVPAKTQVGLNNSQVNSQTVAELKALGRGVNVWFSASTGSDQPSGGARLPGQGWEGVTKAGATSVTTDHPEAYLAWTHRTELCQPVSG